MSQNQRRRQCYLILISAFSFLFISSLYSPRHLLQLTTCWVPRTFLFIYRCSSFFIDQTKHLQLSDIENNNMISVVSATWIDWTSRVYSWYPWPNWYNSLAWLWCLFVHVHQQRRDHRIPFLVKISNFTFQNPLMCKSSGNLGSKFIWNCVNFNMIPFPF